MHKSSTISENSRRRFANIKIVCSSVDIFDTKIDFLEYFYTLSWAGKISRKTDTIDIGSKNLRQGHIKDLADRAQKTNQLVLVLEIICTRPDNNSRLDNDGNRLLTIKTEPQKYIRLFYNLQMLNHRFEQHNFTLVPMYKHGLHHIRYDGQAMHSCLSNLKINDSVKRADFKIEHWRKYFKLPKTCYRKIHGSISTDGVSVSFVMERLVPKKMKDEQITDSYPECSNDPDIDEKDKEYIQRIKDRIIRQCSRNEYLYYMKLV